MQGKQTSERRSLLLAMRDPGEEGLGATRVTWRREQGDLALLRWRGARG